MHVLVIYISGLHGEQRRIRLPFSVRRHNLARNGTHIPVPGGGLVILNIYSQGPIWKPTVDGAGSRTLLASERRQLQDHAFIENGTQNSS